MCEMFLGWNVFLCSYGFVQMQKSKVKSRLEILGVSVEVARD